MSLPLRVIRNAPTTTRIITIHMVSSVELMLGWKVTRSAAPGALSGAKSMTVAGAGNSRLLSMKQAGKAHDSPGASFGEGGKRTNAAMSSTTTAPTSRSQREILRLAFGVGSTPAPRSGSGAGATALVAGCSLDTLPPHTGARRDAALGLSVSPLRAGYSIVLRNWLTSR